MATSMGQSDVIAQIAAALDAHDIRRAAVLADAAGKSGRRDPLIFAARGRWLNEQGFAQDALELLLRAEAISVPSGAIKEAIGLALVSLERMQDAQEAFEAAVTIEPDSASIHFSRARGFEIAGEMTSAQRAFAEVVRLQPRNALALGRLAYIAARLGVWDDARKFAKRATVIEPRQIIARLALALADVEQGVETAERRLTDLLADENVRGSDRYIALGLMGNLRDRQNRPAEAFAEYSRANELFAQMHAARLKAPGMTMYQLVLALTSYFETATPLGPAQSETQPHSTPHIFLLGFPRSGTTLLEQVLASHPDVTALGEKETLMNPFRLPDATDGFSPPRQCQSANPGAPSRSLLEGGRQIRSRFARKGVCRQEPDRHYKTSIDRAAFSERKNPLRLARSARRGSQLLSQSIRHVR